MILVLEYGSGLKNVDGSKDTIIAIGIRQKKKEDRK